MLVNCWSEFELSLRNPLGQTKDGTAVNFLFKSRSSQDPIAPGFVPLAQAACQCGISNLSKTV